MLALRTGAGRSAPLRRAGTLLLLSISLTTLDRPRPASPTHRAELLTVGTTRLRTVWAGTGDTTIVLVHGYGEHLLTWRALLDPLDSQHTVLALDLPGFGASDKPDRPYTLPWLASVVAAVIEGHTTGPVVLVGHSMGGAIAAQVALERPDLIAALVLIAPAGLRIGLGPITANRTPTRAAAIGAWEAARAFVTPLHDPDWLAEPAELADYEPATDPAFRRSTARTLLEFDFEGIGHRFAGIHKPTLLIWGEQDPVVPFSAGRQIAAMLPCRTWATLPRTLHRPHAERPDTVARIMLSFLASPGGCSEAKEVL